MNYLAIDLETYYDTELSITTMGVSAYLAHPDVDIYMVSMVSDTGMEWVGDPKDAPWDQIPEDCEWVAHNRSFDLACVTQLIKDGLDIKLPPRWHCTADLASFCGYPRSLAQASAVVLRKKADKSVRTGAKGKRWPSDFSHDQREAMLDYALQDSRLCMDLWLRLKDKMPEEERLLSEHTSMMGHRGICVDLEKIEEAKVTLDGLIFENKDDIPWVAEGAPTTSPKMLNIYCRMSGIPGPTCTAKDDAGFLEWCAEFGKECPWVEAVGRHRRLNRLVKLVEKFQLYTVDGRLRYDLKYHGAHTGRWSGSGGLNLQNLSSKSLGGVDLRSLLVPKPGHKFVVCDFDQIEAVVALWIVKDERQLKMVREGVDVYETHARTTMGYDDPRPLGEVDPTLRKLAKVRVLGLGYGCGAKKFREVARDQYGVELSEEEALEAVESYRAANPGIVGLWRSLNNQFKSSLRSNFQIALPSGRELNYWDVRMTREVWKYLDEKGEEQERKTWAYRANPIKRGGIAKKFHGGVLMENLVQATARDILAEAILRVEGAGFPVVLHVHDEVVCEVPENTDPELITNLMIERPTWALECPISASSKVMTAYGK